MAHPSDVEIDEWERHAAGGDSWESQIICRLVSLARSLRHELADPNYLYGGRIHRQAILCRNAEIDQLREEIQKLKGVELLREQVRMVGGR